MYKRFSPVLIRKERNALQMTATSCVFEKKQAFIHI